MDAQVNYTPNPQFVDNILPEAATFDYNTVTINKTSGTAGSSAAYVTNVYFTGQRSIHLISDSTTTDLNFNLGTALQHTVTELGRYRVLMQIRQDQNPLQYIPHTLTINVSIGGVVQPSKAIVMTLPTEDDDNDYPNLMKGLWYTFDGYMDLGGGDVPALLNYSFTFETPDVSLSDAEIWIDGFSVNKVDRIDNYFAGSTYTRPKNGLEVLPAVDGKYTVAIASGVATYSKILEASAALNFGSTLAGAVTDLTIALTGAVIGQAVQLGIPVSTVGIYTAWVSAADVVTVRFNNTTAGVVDPASGTFTVKIVP